MQIVTKEVRDGMYDGKVVWICHYNQPDLDKKALRNIPPTKAIILKASSLSTNKKIYYSNSYFAPLTKKEEITKKVISPVDNTGYRTFPGNELFVFDDENECVSAWNEQIDVHLKRFTNVILSVEKIWKDKRSKVANMKK
jgi:hypothetical protein